MGAEEMKEGVIKVSSKRYPVFHYVELASRFLEENEEVELSGLGHAMQSAVSIAEILRNNKTATLTKVHTSLMSLGGRSEKKKKMPKITIVLTRTAEYVEEAKRKKTEEAEATEDVEES